jgi:hypothetical protein
VDTDGRIAASRLAAQHRASGSNESSTTADPFVPLGG